MKTFKIFIAALALASAAPSFAGLCCNYGSPNGPGLNGIAPTVHQSVRQGAAPAQLQRRTSK